MKKEGEVVKSLINLYIENSVSLSSAIESKKDMETLDITTIMLSNIRYTIDAIYFDDTELRNLNPSEVPNDFSVFLFDTKRNMFWKGSYGYTFNISDAAIWDLKTAQAKVKDDFKNETKMVSFNY